MMFSAYDAGLDAAARTRPHLAAYLELLRGAKWGYGVKQIGLFQARKFRWGSGGGDRLVFLVQYSDVHAGEDWTRAGVSRNYLTWSPYRAKAWHLIMYTPWRTAAYTKRAHNSELLWRYARDVTAAYLMRRRMGVLERHDWYTHSIPRNRT